MYVEDIDFLTLNDSEANTSQTLQSVRSAVFGCAGAPWASGTRRWRGGKSPVWPAVTRKGWSLKRPSLEEAPGRLER